MTNENNTKKNKDVVKRRIFVLLRLLYEQTDEEHQMTSDELVEYLKEKKVPANKKTLKSDIDLMTEAGLDIVTVSSKPNRYFWGSRHFEVPELKLLIDAVSSSRFITQKKSEQLVKNRPHVPGRHAFRQPSGHGSRYRGSHIHERK